MSRVMPMFVTAIATIVLITMFGMKPSAEKTPGFVATPPVAVVDPVSVSPPAASDSAVVESSPPPSAVLERYTILEGELVSGAPVVRVAINEPVVLELITDRADELHVHGYDLHQEVLPGATVRIQFVAHAAGRFPMEMHKSGIELGVLEVHPQ